MRHGRRGGRGRHAPITLAERELIGALYRTEAIPAVAEIVRRSTTAVYSVLLHDLGFDRPMRWQQPEPESEDVLTLPLRLLLALTD